MTYQPQHIVAPDGTELVVITRSDYDRLTTAMAGREGDADRARRAAAELAAAGGGMPAAVLDMLLDDGVTPLTAWRRHRGLSQAALAARAGIAQTAVSRLERADAGAGRATTRRALARALDAPEWTLVPLD